MRYAIAIGAVVVIVVAVWFSNRRTVALDSYDPDASAPPPTAIEPAPTIEESAEQPSARKSPTT